MKKLFLFIGFALLIVSFSFAQRNFNAGKLDVSKNATFKKDVLLTSSIIAAKYTCFSTYSGQAIILTNFTGDISKVFLPQEVILSGGSCDGSTAVVETLTNMGGNWCFWLNASEYTDCDDFTHVTISSLEYGHITAQGGATMQAETKIIDGYEFLFRLDCEGPSFAYGTLVETFTGDLLSNGTFDDATHFYYPELTSFKSDYYKIDSITYDSQWNSTQVFFRTGPVGQVAAIKYVDVYRFMGGKGNLNVFNQLSVGKMPSQDATLAVDGDVDITGKTVLHYINDYDASDWNYNCDWVSGDSILLPYDYGDATHRVAVGDYIEKTDLTWSGTVTSVEYGYFADLHQYYGSGTLIRVSSAPGVVSGQFKIYNDPDIIVGGGATFDLDDGVYVKTFRGASDPDITGWIMTNASGTPCYVYPSSAGTGIVVSTTKP